LYSLGNTTFIAFMRVISLSLTTTLGYESTLINNPLIVLRTHTKLFSHSDASKINVTKKLNPIEVVKIKEKIIMN